MRFSERAIGLAPLIGPIEVGAAMGVQCTSASLSQTGILQSLRASRGDIDRRALHFLVRNGDLVLDGTGHFCVEGDPNEEREFFF